MPKLKTHKGTVARYKATGTGKIMRMKRGSSHLRRKKSRAVRGQYDSKVPASVGESRRVRRLAPGITH
jgi:large subunit ribosomal protein L35